MKAKQPAYKTAAGKKPKGKAKPAKPVTPKFQSDAIASKMLGDAR